MMTELAALYRDRLGDRDQAAVYLHAILQIEPENQMALAAYADHFREKGDWAALADLLEFAFEQRARARASPIDELLPRLEEIAVVCEKQPRRRRARARRLAARRGARARPTPGRARRRSASCSRPRAGTAWSACWSARPAAQTDPAQKAEILRRVAQIYREKLGNAARAIEIYKEILRAGPAGRGGAARAGRDLRARGATGAEPGAAAARAARASDAEAGARRACCAALLVLYDERLADLQPRERGPPTRSCSWSPAIATR